MPIGSADPHPLRFLPEVVHAELARQCRELDIPHNGSVFILREGLFDVLGVLSRLGAQWSLLSGASEATYSAWRVRSDSWFRRREQFQDLVITDSDGLFVVDHLTGSAEIRLGDDRFLLSAIRMPSAVPNAPARHNITLLAGGTAASQRELVRRYILAERERGSIQFWTGKGLTFQVPPVREDEVILPATVKQPLLDWLDRFWHQIPKARKLGLALHRGVLLLGVPGTGKTQLIRHILTRYPEREGHLFVATATGATSDSFGRMVDAVCAPGRPKIVVLEDIDRLAEASVPQAHLLNALDGLLRSESPVLWIATSNDPTALSAAIVDRPGRFDRVVVIPPPGPRERAEMVRLFTAGKVSAEIAQLLADKADGLTGAHLRETCNSATLASLEDGRGLDEALVEELDRMRRQHAESRAYLRNLTGQPIGFGQEEPGHPRAFG